MSYQKDSGGRFSLGLGMIAQAGQVAQEATRQAREHKKLREWEAYAECMEQAADAAVARCNAEIMLRDLAVLELKGAIVALKSVAPKHPYLHGGQLAIRQRRLAEIEQQLLNHNGD
jgi:hypothetical protein